jgi:prolyl oligopeptidase
VNEKRSTIIARFFGRCIAGCCVAICFLFLTVPTMKAQDANSKCPPAARTDNVADNYFGTTVIDPYRWLEDQTSPETRAWIEAENQCTESFFSKLPGKEEIAKRLEELLRADIVSAPIERGGKYFYSKRAAGQDLSVLCVRRGLGGAEEVLVDPAPMSADHTTSVSFEGISQDGRIVAYGIRKGGEDEVTIHFLESESRRELADSLPRARYFSGVWFNRMKTGFYYSKYAAEGPRVMYHEFGKDASQDETIFGKGLGPEKILDVNESEDGRYLLMTIVYGSSCEKSEVYFQDLEKQGPIETVVNSVRSCFQGRIAGDTLYMATNYKAPNWRLVAVPLAHPSEENWREIIPEENTRLETFRLVGGKIVAQYIRNASSELKIFGANGKAGGSVTLPQIGTVGQLQGEWSGKEAFFSFASFAIPPTIYRYDVDKGALEAWAKPNVPIDSSTMEMKQVWYTSKDKTRVPMFLFYKKGLTMDGARPTLLTGYGGFDLSETPGFNVDAVLWVERGGVFAVPNLRGGGEFGEAWHHEGMLEKKQNVFDDFIAAGEWLVQNHYTRPEKLAIEGRSNGGLLVGAALTQRPDLFGAVICGYPLLDMLRYENFLVARFWVPEYGSAENPSQFSYLYAYSPYHHVVPARKYPAVLFITGDSDTRVAPLHARKMTARLQAAQGGEKPILLLYDTKLGHSEGRPVKKIIEEDTQTLSFLFSELGVQPN